MWNKSKEQNAFIVTITPRTVTCSHISRKTSSSPLSLQSYHNNTFDNLELENLILFNPTNIARHIHNYYKPIQSKKTPALIALQGPSLYTKIVSVTTAHPQLEHFNLSHAPHWLWHYSYLYSKDHRHYFYVCGIKRTLLLQYQLLSISAQIPLCVITTEYMALLHLYRHIFGTAFRHTQLGEALAERNNNVEQLFTKDDLYRVLSIPSSQKIIDKDHIPLLTACGLFVAEGLPS